LGERGGHFARAEKTDFELSHADFVAVNRGWRKRKGI
jgi:hypothetical protein